MTREEKTALFVALTPVIAKVALTEYAKYQRRKRMEEIRTRIKSMTDSLINEGLFKNATPKQATNIIDTTCTEA